MKLLAGLVASVALFGGVQFLDGGDSESAAVEPAASSTYRLTANGDEAACAVQRGAAVSDGLSRLKIAPDCRQLMPGIERAKFWREQADGSVAFSENGIVRSSLSALPMATATNPTRCRRRFWL
ncbi:hypothetical protein [Mesorhizobium sp.]|uniref:hypothetical protein n=1 Tax=Mesorhizobium sp. TaxID=1871066 RepID=UPI0034127FCA